MSNPTIGFIGYGNMAQAIAEGLVAPQGVVLPDSDRVGAVLSLIHIS